LKRTRFPRSQSPEFDGETPSTPPTEDIPSTSTSETGVKTQTPVEPPINKLFGLELDKVSDDLIQDIVRRQIEHILAPTGLAEEYDIVIFYDEAGIGHSDASRVYTALAASDPDKPNLLVLNSTGGDIAAAYLIAKLCRDYTKKSFEVAVPRQAKSAATLICCGADKIHMGSLSELGPIDPQFDGVPALALKHSVEHIAQLVSDYPQAANMFSNYLSKSLKVESLGYYERVAESATQYAIRLLASRPKVESDNPSIAHRLVYHYKDHGFVIDSREAIEIFGSEVVACNTTEYDAANEMIRSLDLANWMCDSKLQRRLTYIGSVAGGCWVFPKRRR